jgi:hypothetical protein
MLFKILIYAGTCLVLVLIYNIIVDSVLFDISKSGPDNVIVVTDSQPTSTFEQKNFSPVLTENIAGSSANIKVNNL